MKNKYNEYLEYVKPFFPKAFINDLEELIVVPQVNAWFRLDNVESIKELECKMIEYLSRYACKCPNKYWRHYIRRGLNSMFRKTWGNEEWMDVYSPLGNAVNRDLCMVFVCNGLKLEILEKHIEMRASKIQKEEGLEWKSPKKT